MDHSFKTLALSVIGAVLAGSLPAEKIHLGENARSLSELVGCHCYSIVPKGDDAVDVCVHRTAYSLGRTKSLWYPNKDGCPREAEELEDGSTVTIRLGERLGFCATHLPAAGAASALYVLKGSDLPPDLKVPAPYREARLLIGFSDQGIVGRELFFFRYLANPSLNTWYDLQRDLEGRMFFPFNTTAIPDYGCAPAVPAAPRREQFGTRIRHAESCLLLAESEVERISRAGDLAVVRALGAGTNLVSYANRKPFVSLSRAIEVVGPDGRKSILGTAEIMQDDWVFLSRLDARGRIRWAWMSSPAARGYPSTRSVHRYPGDGTVEFSCGRHGDGDFEAFTFREKTAAFVPDGPGLRKILAEVDEGFRRLFGFQGTGELTLDEIKKGLQ